MTASDNPFSRDFSCWNRIFALFSSSTRCVSTVYLPLSRTSCTQRSSASLNSVRSRCTLMRFPDMLGLSLRDRTRLFVDSLRARETSCISSCTSLYLFLFTIPFMAALCSIRISYRFSRFFCSSSVRAISSPMNLDSSSRCCRMSGVMLSRKDNFSVVSSRIAFILSPSRNPSRSSAFVWCVPEWDSWCPLWVAMAVRCQGVEKNSWLPLS
mmetsp:Transcript_27372/g.60602  ORF Transcript_27372/g.60602 Transcript_27372/m.60602 type:complete len:211 (-) Transcript_27372:146-778(-)